MYVAIGALVILILVLIILGVSLSKLQSMDSYPPTQNACPDFWDVSSNPAYCGVFTNSNAKNRGYIGLQTTPKTGTDIKPIDTAQKQNIGLCTASSKLFGCSGDQNKTFLELAAEPTASGVQYMKLSDNTNWGKLYPNSNERCAKKKWANTMNITWDGVTNYNGC